MKFDELDSKMRVFETAHDHCVLPEIVIVARLDGRGFTRLTKEVHPFEAPFDERFRDLMIRTVEHLMRCGFEIVYGYTQSDEISLLFARHDASFGRKERKLNSILAGEASAAFALALGAHACFDSRICQLPTRELVRDYFRWRREDAHRNALNAHCYWVQRKQGVDVGRATRKLEGMSTVEKREFLLEMGIDFDAVPSWQKHGVGVFWEKILKEAIDRRTGAPVTAERRALHVELELPAVDDYDALVLGLLGDE